MILVSRPSSQINKPLPDQANGGPPVRTRERTGLPAESLQPGSLVLHELGQLRAR
jgi:hypothetical protein